MPRSNESAGRPQPVMESPRRRRSSSGSNTGRSTHSTMPNYRVGSSYGHTTPYEYDILSRYGDIYDYSDPGSYSRYGRCVEPPTPRGGETEEDVLKVSEVNYLVEKNCESHNTDEYEITQDKDFLSRKQTAQLVVRRGQPFDISIKFNKEYKKDKDDLKLIFEIGNQPMPSKGTLVEIILSDKDVKGKWGAKIKEQKDETVILTIFTPPNCYIGKWNFKVDVIKQGERSSDKLRIYRYKHRHPVYILFNAWCKEDAVYMASDNDRDEYILNETGKIYAGSKDNISAKPWNFAQFQGQVLDAAMYVLDNSGLTWTSRGDIVKVSRKISAMVNAPDDNGILVGNWSGDYSGGRSPLSWTGSEAILERYYQFKRPVEFGQCWVFSGVTTTVCRTLGIPARSVTNFASAHDSDGTITIDIHWDEKGEPMNEHNIDSVWNFHVWNEAYMARPDLPKGYGGWQAIDATPQETSDGVYCCGPASLVAIKRGEVHYPYDGSFVFAEVNADKVHWVLQADGEWRKIFQKAVIGKHISTKCKGESCGGINSHPDKDDPDREDLTSEYKFREDSEEERTAVLRAQVVNRNTDKVIYDTGPEDVTFELVDKDEIFMGEGFYVALKVSNESRDTRNISVRQTATLR